MKILFSSHAFFPSIGGLEAVSMMLAREFVCAGHEVIVVTQTPAGEERLDLPFRVVRRPTLLELLHLVTWSDLVFHSNISLRTAWPLSLIPRPWIVVHHGFIPRKGGITGLKGCVKHFMLRWATNIAVSEAVARDFSEPVVVISNPYDDVAFKLMHGIERNRDLIFVGRFVSDKGLPVLLDALVTLRERGMTPELTVVGDGPEAANWRNITARFGLSGQVRFVGIKRGQKLTEELNAHHIMVVPSLWNEPYGIVALEGMACGCVVIGSEGGGLSEAIGPGGLTFPNGDADALADRLNCLLNSNDLYASLRAASTDHLACHQSQKVAEAYLAVINNMINKWPEKFYAK